MLTQAQIEQFNNDGYTIVEDFFDESEVTLMQRELERLVAEGEGRNVATEDDGATHSNTKFNVQIMPLNPKSDIYRALPFAEKIRKSVTSLIGDDFFLLLDQIFLKPPKQGAGTNWHQDNAYFQIDDPTCGTGMWIAIHDATIENGTMRIIPSSHLRTFSHDRDPGSDHHITCIVNEDEEDIRPIEVKAGGVLFFNFGIVHCTKANTTDKERAGLALHFLQTQKSKLNGERNSSKPILSGMDYSGGMSEYGETIEGDWETRITALN